MSARLKHNLAQIAAGAERRETVLRLRADGWTYKQIAAELGISPSRVVQLHARGVRLRRDGILVEPSTATPDTRIESLPMSLRTLAALAHGGYETLAQVTPLDDEMERRLLLLPNFGRPCLDELREIVSAMNDRGG